MDRSNQGSWRHGILPLAGVAAVAVLWLLRPHPLPEAGPSPKATSAAVAGRELPGGSARASHPCSPHSAEPSLLVVHQRPVALPDAQPALENVCHTAPPVSSPAAPPQKPDLISKELSFAPVSTTPSSSAFDSALKFPMSSAPAAPPAKARPEAEAASKAVAQPNDKAVAPSGVRSEQLEAAAQEADRHTRDGFNLAGRGAHFAARSEFLTALRIVAESLDAERRTRRHSQALSAAITALAEAEDFIPRQHQYQGDIEVAALVRAHRTATLKQAGDVVPAEAMKSYLTFAQEQLAIAGGAEVAGSMALHALGKLHNTLGQARSSAIQAVEAKSVVFFQAALLVYPRNHLASHELGVLLARCGRYAEARTALEHSLSLYPQPTGWVNLATVYRQLGLTDRAQRAVALAQQPAAVAGTPAPAAVPIRWVDSAAFAQLPTDAATLPSALPLRQGPQQAAPAMPAATGRMASPPSQTQIPLR